MRPCHVRELEVYGTTVRVATWPGSGTRPPLLLFNGIGASTEILAPFADAVGDVEVIAFDVPGTGGSGRAPVPYRLWMLALLTTRLLDRLGHGPVDVLGVSWGGALAQQFALQNPRRCRRLVLAATSPGTLMVPPTPAVLRQFLTPRRYNDPAFRRSVAGAIYGGRARVDPGVADEFRRASRRGYLLQQLALAGWTSLPFLPLLKQRTLILAGDDDPVIPLANAHLMRRAIPDASLHVLADGHLFLISSAEEAGAVTREFLLGPS